MYILYRIDPNTSHLVSSKGLRDYPKPSDEEYTLNFASLDKAIKYAQAFVNRYPSVYCEIYTEDNSKTPIEVIQNIKYLESGIASKINYKKSVGKNYLQLFFMYVFSIPIFLVSYIITSFELSFFLAIFIVLIGIFIIWFMLEMIEDYSMRKDKEKYCGGN